MKGILNEMAGMVAFVRTVETGSFSAAAKSLGLTPSAASKSVSRLELLLGAKLFRRSTRTLSRGRCVLWARDALDAPNRKRD
ncbi:helix-turn-helix domain-containing protein [Sinorhizobium medicae]|nr:LysR family transcriptional regulator [Sinorhizobium medicae]